MRTLMIFLAVSVFPAVSGMANAGTLSSANVILDTPTNLDVTWTYDPFSASFGEESSSATLQYWSATATVIKISFLPRSPKFIVKVSAGLNADQPPVIPGLPPSADRPYIFAGSNSGAGYIMNYTVTDMVGDVTYTFSVTQDSAISGQWDIALRGAAPVPEPETYAMMLAGIGMIGFMARRRMQAV